VRRKTGRGELTRISPIPCAPCWGENQHLHRGRRPQISIATSK
jgi:hypothetical protein